MFSEGDLEPSYRRTLNQAIAEDQLITVRSLSSSFPSDSELAHLSYAQSYSLVEFILDEYGSESMAQLLRVFAEGAYYDDALQDVLGLSSEGLDAAWREWAEGGGEVEPLRQSTPTSEQRSPRNLLYWASAGLCCMAGLLAVVATGVLVFVWRR